MMPFEYPTTPYQRRHGPQGYAEYSEYRDWIRDEFAFRCVFCLRREVWLGSSTVFHADHAVAQKHAPHLTSVYENLLYLCATCNSRKQDRPLIDPCAVSLAECLEVHPDGMISAKNDAGRRLVLVLRLDSADQVSYRRRMTMLRRDPKYVGTWFCYPQDLPDLRTRRPPKGNTKPEGAENCYLARRERGELEEIY